MIPAIITSFLSRIVAIITNQSICQSAWSSFSSHPELFNPLLSFYCRLSAHPLLLLYLLLPQLLMTNLIWLAMDRELRLLVVDVTVIVMWLCSFLLLKATIQQRFFALRERRMSFSSPPRRINCSFGSCHHQAVAAIANSRLSSSWTRGTPKLNRCFSMFQQNHWRSGFR